MTKLRNERVGTPHHKSEGEKLAASLRKSIYALTT